MKYLPILFTVFILFFGVVSCTAPIDLKTNDSEPVIVIYGCLNEQMTYQTIKISGSSPYFEEKQNPLVSDAVVTIESSENELFELKERSYEKGIYQTTVPMAAVAGVTYRLKVVVDFDKDGVLETYEAMTTMPRLFELDSIGIDSLSIMGYKHYALNLFGQEEAGEDYYLCRITLNDTIERFKLSEYIAFSDVGFDDSYIDKVALMYIDDISNDVVDEEDGYLLVQSGDKITLYTSRIEKTYYDFIWQCQQERTGENPFFGGPASNITTNISNGGVGYFTSFYTSVQEAYVP